MINQRSFFPCLRAGVLAGVAVAALLVPGYRAVGQQATAAAQQPAVAGNVQDNAKPSSKKKHKRSREEKKEDRVQQTKATKRELRKRNKDNPLAGVEANLPDKELYDKALNQVKHGHFDVARLDLQTLMNTYPDSQFLMRAKLAVADSWYKEGGTAALTQAEAEYKDFITFFPNSPEAAEAQMRVGDIYFRQMDKPDRDYSKVLHAEQEYRLMLQQFPQSTLVPQAQQRLREVQEVLATRESEIAAFYASRNNWPATIARYQTVVDTYPLYSHLDESLIGLGDAYEAEAHYVRALRLPEAAKARLERIYDDQAAAAYRKVVLEHSAAPHVEDAKDRLAAMNLPIPTPTPQQVAASVALENSRATYKMSDRVSLLFFHKPDYVEAARMGTPTMVDPKPTLAPDVSRKVVSDFREALNPNAAKAAEAPAKAAAPAPTTTASTGNAPASAPATPAKPLQLEDVPTASGNAEDNSAVMTSVPGTANYPSSAASGNSVGAEIVSPSDSGAAPADNGGLKPVAPPNATPLPAVEKAAPAPNQVNDIQPGSQPPAQTSSPDGKKHPKPSFDKDEESSSTHKKKKGLKRLNPF